jgi:hypothetical protein
MKAVILAGFLVAGWIPAQSALSTPSNARIYVDAGDEFDIFLTAALEKKHVPLAVTADKSQAAFVLEGFAGRDKTARVRLVDLKCGDVIFAYSAASRTTIHGRRTAAESCAKHLGAAIGGAPRKTVAKRLMLTSKILPLIFDRREGGYPSIRYQSYYYGELLPPGLH